MSLRKVVKDSYHSPGSWSFFVQLKNFSHYIVGLMSGTSLDGLDIALCYLENNSGGWSHEILCAETIAYSEEWKRKLKYSMKMSGHELALLDVELGEYFGTEVKHFLTSHNATADFIASHGHTVFHDPGKKMTLQIGKGSSLAAAAGLPVICDFRTSDIARGGQGAPLVPVGDGLLFSEYDFCLNLGGIANISFDLVGERQAFDICPANMALDLLAQQMNMQYDAGGQLARTGIIKDSLLRRLNDLPYYHQEPPKSLGREWFDATFLPLLKSSGHAYPDLLATCCEHIAHQTARILNGWNGRMLITGGGAWNTFLIERIQTHTSVQCIVPGPDIVNFKEALVFALLGALRWRGETNTLASVTGADRDSCGGSIYL